ncbi:MAG TPA: hypothetical protein PK876_02385 [Elusimicrobiota bacterium]|nr:hypothetical protein [Elusimicrobiota bacterium]
MVTDPLIVSDKYLWHEDSDEFKNIITKESFSGSSFEGKVNVFEDRMQGWFLQVARKEIANGPSTADYVALSIGLAYIEGIEQYRRGRETPRNKSGKWFRESARRILKGVSGEITSRLWKELRNGLFHTGFTIGFVYLSHGYKEIVELNGERLQINPNKFVNAVIEDFNKYITELRKGQEGEIGRQFLKLWDKRWEES